MTNYEKIKKEKHVKFFRLFVEEFERSCEARRAFSERLKKKLDK